MRPARCFSITQLSNSRLTPQRLTDSDKSPLKLIMADCRIPASSTRNEYMICKSPLLIIIFTSVFFIFRNGFQFCRAVMQKNKHGFLTL